MQEPMLRDDVIKSSKDWDTAVTFMNKCLRQEQAETLEYKQLVASRIQSGSNLPHQATLGSFKLAQMDRLAVEIEGAKGSKRHLQ